MNNSLMKRLRLAVIGVAIAVASALATQEDQGQPAGSADDEAAVIEMAASALGTLEVEVHGATVTRFASPASSSGLNLPAFLDTIVKSREIWKIDFANVLVREVQGGPGLGEGYRRPFSVYLESAKGMPIMIQSIRPTDRVLSEREMDPLVREQRFLESVSFGGLPEDPPLDFISTLQNCPFSPHLAERIAAVYVNELVTGTDTVIPVWVISLIGIPPIEPPSSGLGMESDVKRIPEHMRNAACVIMDARTGKPIRAKN